MTLAVCLNCGEMKHGGFSPCDSCQFEPFDEETFTKSLLLTDHYFSHEELENISELIKGGKEPAFDPEALQRAWVTMDELEQANKGCRRGLIAFMVIFIGSLVAILGTVAVVLLSEIIPLIRTFF